MTKSICFIFAAGLALAAVASAEITEEESFAEATSFVQSFMTEGAQGDSACLKVANDEIGVIQTACDGEQKTIDAAAQANQKCCKSGKAAVCVAATSVTTLSGKSANCEKEADVIQNAQITVTTHTSLGARTGGECDAIDDSSAYKTKQAEHTRKSTECSELKGESTEAKKVLAAAVSAAAAKRTTCNNDAESALASAFQNAEATCNSQQNRKKYTRAMHMKCVLDGTPLAQCNTGKAPSVTKTNLSALNCKAITAETTCEIPGTWKGSTCKDQGVSGFRIQKKGKVAFLYAKPGTNWVRNKNYKCPNGWHFGTRAEFVSRCTGGSGHNGHNMCGCSGGSCGGFTVSKFRFSDSKNGLCAYAHMGSGECGANHNSCSLNHFAGIICVRN